MFHFKGKWNKMLAPVWFCFLLQIVIGLTGVMGFTGSELKPGDIEFNLSFIPETWDGNPNGMVQPRDSPTSEVYMEFSAISSSISYSVVHADSTVTASDDMTKDETLANYDSWVLDLFIQHSNVLWPCVSAEGRGNLRIKSYDSSSHRYTVNAEYVMNSKGEYFFNSTLVTVPI